jgi:hypothetical protein
MEPFIKALETIARIMQDGVATHPDNDWTDRSTGYYLAYARAHLLLLRQGDLRHDHLAHAATHLLMALTLRELG